MTDHAAESEQIAYGLNESVIAHEGITDATIIATAIDAHRHAVLALVEQQRIANLIALGQFRVGVNDLPHLRHLAIEPKDEQDVQPVAEIRDALGLS